MSLGGQIRRYLVPFVAVLVIAVLAVVVALYVLAHQRVQFPWEHTYSVNIEVSSAQAITPGQGQTIDVAGVAVGAISRVDLKNGIAVVKGDIDPDKLPHVYSNATALVRPKTGLQDMVIELNPGHPPARPLPDGGTIPVSSTQPEVNLDEVISGLDSDTRDYLRVLIGSGARGLRHRGADLRRLFKASGPTLRLTKRVTQAIADRRHKVARLVDNLRVLGQATASKDKQLAQLVSAGDAALRAIDREEGPLRAGLDKLPGTVQAARAALASARPFANQLGPTLDALTPATRKLTPALRSAKPLVKQGAPELGSVLDLVRAARPVTADLRPATADLLQATPSLTESFKVLRYVTNELAYNPPGKEEGYLFWLAWFGQNASSLLRSGDAQGIFWRGQVMTSCSTLPLLNDLANSPLGILFKSAPCPSATADLGVGTKPIQGSVGG